MCYAVGTAIQFGIRERLLSADNRSGFRGALAVSLEERCNCYIWNITDCCIALFENYVPFFGAEHLHPEQRQISILEQNFQQFSIVAGHLLHPPWIKQVTIIEPIENNSARMLSSMHLQIKANAQFIADQWLHFHSRQPLQLCCSVLEGKHHLKDRGGIQAALGRQLFHQPLKRKILVLVCLKRSSAHPRQQLPEAFLLPHAHPHHQGIGEKAD